MMDHDALGHSSILTSLEDLTWPEKGVGLRRLSPCSRERLVLRDRGPRRVLVYTMALSGRIVSSSQLIHKGCKGIITEEALARRK
jgi:hypothetical protein